VLEEYGVEQVDTFTPLVGQIQAVIDAAKPLFALDVSRATALSEEEEPEIMLSLHGGIVADALRSTRSSRNTPATTSRSSAQRSA
jgi:hypothetical protein